MLFRIRAGHEVKSFKLKIRDLQGQTGRSANVPRIDALPRNGRSIFPIFIYERILAKNVGRPK